MNKFTGGREEVKKRFFEGEGPLTISRETGLEPETVVTYLKKDLGDVETGRARMRWELEKLLKNVGDGGVRSGREELTKRLGIDAGEFVKAAEEAEDMFQRFAEEQGSFVGRSIEDLAATCLLLALEKNGSVTGSGEFAAATGGVQKTGLKTRRTVTKILGEPLEPPGLKTHVSRVGKALELKPSLIEEAEKMAEKTGIKKSNRALSTKVAAALYLTLDKQGLAGMESQFLRRVGEKVSVNPKSVKRAIREMNET